MRVFDSSLGFVDSPLPTIKVSLQTSARQAVVLWLVVVCGDARYWFLSFIWQSLDKLCSDSRSWRELHQCPKKARWGGRDRRLWGAEEAENYGGGERADQEDQEVPGGEQESEVHRHREADFESSCHLSRLWKEETRSLQDSGTFIFPLSSFI